eukprot:3019867-Amphidinium_carterae.1
MTFLKLGEVDASERRLPEPKTFAEGVTKLTNHLQDVEIAVNLLNTLGLVQMFNSTHYSTRRNY